MPEKQNHRVQNSTSNRSVRFLYLYFAETLPCRVACKLSCIPPCLICLVARIAVDAVRQLKLFSYHKFVSIVQQLQFPLLFEEAEKQLVMMQGSEKTNYTQLMGTISLKLSSSFRRSLAYGGSCVTSLVSSSISMPLSFNMEREGTIFHLMQS